MSPAQYVAAGIVPFDGESLTVYLGTIDQGQPGAPIGSSFQVAAATVLWATFYVQILREAPALSGGGTAQDLTPDVDVLGEAGLEAMSDAAALTQAAIALHAFYAVTGPGEGFVVGPVGPLGPEGGISGMRIALHVSLS